MKRQELVRHLESHRCYLLRDRGKHSIYVNSANNQTSTVSRRVEINKFIAQKICRDLGIPEP